MVISALLGILTLMFGFLFGRSVYVSLKERYMDLRICGPIHLVLLFGTLIAGSLFCTSVGHSQSYGIGGAHTLKNGLHCTLVVGEGSVVVFSKTAGKKASVPGQSYVKFKDELFSLDYNAQDGWVVSLPRDQIPGLTAYVQMKNEDLLECLTALKYDEIVYGADSTEHPSKLFSKRTTRLQ